MRYRINWTESVGYFAYVEAESAEEALRIFHEDGPSGFSPPDAVPEPDGFCEMQDDAEATEDPDEAG